MIQKKNVKWYATQTNLTPKQVFNVLLTSEVKTNYICFRLVGTFSSPSCRTSIFQKNYLGLCIKVHIRDVCPQVIHDLGIRSVLPEQVWKKPRHRCLSLRQDQANCHYRTRPSYGLLDITKDPGLASGDGRC